MVIEEFAAEMAMAGATRLTEITAAAVEDAAHCEAPG
jgi:hypothetical protein